METARGGIERTQRHYLHRASETAGVRELPRSARIRYRDCPRRGEVIGERLCSDDRAGADDRGQRNAPPHGEIRRSALWRSLRKEVLDQRRQRQTHSEPGDGLRNDEPANVVRRQKSERADAAADQRAPGNDSRFGVPVYEEADKPQWERG
jgi:hypothetical protein